MDWYRGPTLLDHLEQVELALAARDTAASACRCNWSTGRTPDFRGYSGAIASGDVYVGMPVRDHAVGPDLPIDRIVTYDGDLERARRPANP